MGADLIIVAFSEPHDKNNQPLGYEAAAPTLHARIDALDAEQILGPFENLALGLGVRLDENREEWLDAFYEEFDDAIGLTPENWVRKRLHEFVDQELFRSHRATTHELVSGHWIIIHGGTSWGDSPSDEWDAYCAFAESGVTEEAI